MYHNTKLNDKHYVIISINTEKDLMKFNTYWGLKITFNK